MSARRILAVAFALSFSVASALSAATPQERPTVTLRPDVMAAYTRFAASDTAKLIQLQGKMATPNIYLAQVASGKDKTGATPATYWYVRNGIHDEGVSMAPEAVLDLNLKNLKAARKITDFNFNLVANLGHTENVSTPEAFAWMDPILAKASPSAAAKAGPVKPAAGAWWDVTAYQGGTYTENATSGAVTASSDTGKRELTVTLDGQPFHVTHYWGWYAAQHNSPAQKISIYVPQNVRPDSPTFFRVNNSGWSANGYRSTVTDGAAYTTTGLAFNTVLNQNAPAVIGTVLSKGMILVSYGARSMADAPVNGQYLGHSPATMTDTKAAIRFLKYNQVHGALPGDPNRVIITGMSGGGGLTAIVAASGDSSDYFDSLAQIGALGLTKTGSRYTNDKAAGDAVFATFSSAPIIDLAVMDYANEWMYNPTRRKVAAGDYANAAGITNGRNRANYLPDWQNLASDYYAQADGYTDYIRSLGLSPDTVKRTLFDMLQVALERTINENRSYRPELANVSAVTTPAQAKAALDTFLRYAQGNPAPQFAALPLDWYSVTGAAGHFVVTIPNSSWDAYCEYMYWTGQWVKGPPATGGGNQPADLGKAGPFASGESNLWGLTSEKFNATNPVSWALDLANWPQFGAKPSTATDTPTRQAENRATAASLFVKAP